MPTNIATLKKHPLPKDMLLIPGVIETTSNFVEHPELVARRIEEAVATVGDRERVIASTDCGFGTFAGSGMGDRAGGVAEARGIARRGRHRLGAAVGKKSDLAAAFAAVGSSRGRGV